MPILPEWAHFQAAGVTIEDIEAAQARVPKGFTSHSTRFMPDPRRREDMEREDRPA